MKEPDNSGSYHWEEKLLKFIVKFKNVENQISVMTVEANNKANAVSIAMATELVNELIHVKEKTRP